MIATLSLGQKGRCVFFKLWSCVFSGEREFDV